MGKGHDDAEVVVVMERSISKLRNRDEARSFTGSGALRGSSVKVEECRASDCWPLCLASDDPVRGPAGTCADEGCLACAPVRLLFRRVSCGGAFDCSSSGGLSCSFGPTSAFPSQELACFATLAKLWQLPGSRRLDTKLDR